MCPEYGATAAYFPVDAETLRYLTFTGRGDRVDLVERYTKEQGLFRRDGDPEPVFTEVLDLDLAAVVPSMAGPKRPQDRVALPDVWGSFVAAFRDHAEPDPKAAEIGRFMAEGGTTRQEALPGSDVMDVEVAPARDDAIGARIGRDRRHHVVHQHVEPVRDGGGGAARHARRWRRGSRRGRG